MTAHTPTLLLAIIIVGAVSALSVGAVASRENRDGMRYWAAGLALHTLSYIIYMQMGLIGTYLAISLGTLFRSLAWAAFAEGLCEFQRRPAPRTLIWAPVVLSFLSLVGLFEWPTLRLIASILVLAVQSLIILVFMLQRWRQTQGRGRYFLISGIALATTLLLLRAAVASGGKLTSMVSVTESSPIQTVSILGALITLMLLAIGFLLMSKDRADERNRLLAGQDELTGLANRRRLNEVLAAEWAISKRFDRPLALAMIDIDHFKAYNDQYGHPAGDECIKRVAQALQSSARRGGDLVARYGGEEFLLVLPDTPVASCHRLAEQVRKVVESLDLQNLRSPMGKVTISVGIAALTAGNYQDAESMLGAADQALYRAKHAGRNQVASA